jgi:CRP-like cAMP-binding protein
LLTPAAVETGIEKPGASRSVAYAREDMPLTAGHIIRNGILSALPPADLEQLRPHLQQLPLWQRQILHEAGATIEHVHFIEEGVASVLTTTAEGDAVEVRMAGREGITGFPYVLGAHSLRHEIIVQAPGSALRMSAAAFKSEFDRSEALRRIVLRYIDLALSMTAQTAACNSMHSVEQRCGRLLLNASDRIGSNTMPMTHEFLAALLGVRRAGVTVVAGKLQSSGLIRYHRGRLTILDREGLERDACDCYHADRQKFAWHTAAPPPRHAE